MFKFVLVLMLLFKSALTDVSYYDLLGVSKQASTQEIRQAYKKLAVKLHPDKNDNKGEQKKFLEITKAYETLKDPSTRKDYDIYGSQQSYTRKYDYHSQREYNKLYFNGLYHNDPFVETLSHENFSSYLDKGLYFINFYSPFCPPCQNLVDHWRKLAEVYKGILKVGAVNCKYYISFCYSKRIISYPTLLFYPNGDRGSFLQYNGAHKFESLEEFALKFIRSQVYMPMAAQVVKGDKPILYVLNEDNFEEHALLRIAYHLRGLVSVVMAGHNQPRISDNPETVMVYIQKEEIEEIQSTDEKEIIKEVVDMLPPIEKIGLEKFKKIRNNFRNGAKKPWILYFIEEDSDMLPVYQMKINTPDMNFGVMQCASLPALCGAAGAGRWGVLKAGGAWQCVRRAARVREAARALALHTLSAHEFARLLDGDVTPWVLLVVPYQVSWEFYEDAFTQASIKLLDSGISFGITSCTLNTDKYCRLVAHNEPVIIVQNGTNRHFYTGDANKDDIVEFIEHIIETHDLKLSEEQVYEIQEGSSRSHTWAVAYLPADCRHCRHLLHEWRIVAKRLRPLQLIRVGVLDCSTHKIAFCDNIRTATARIYTQDAVTFTYGADLQHITEAKYILVWLLDKIDFPVEKLTWHSFKNVIAEELNPSRNKKPWLIYFFSPRLPHCYEMYPEFAIIAYYLQKSVQFGKVNCLKERNICQHEHITSLPSIKLYLSRNQQNSVSRAIQFQPKDYSSLLEDIKPHLTKYDQNILANINNVNIKDIHFRDEL